MALNGKLSHGREEREGRSLSDLKSKRNRLWYLIRRKRKILRKMNLKSFVEEIERRREIIVTSSWLKPVKKIHLRVRRVMN